MKTNKQQAATVIAALIMGAIIAAIVIYILTRELRETLTRTNYIGDAGALARGNENETNMNIEHSSSYNQSVRGYRNNNPLNLRISSNNWKGKVPTAENTDGSFEQFTTMPYGFRAALKNLQAYITKYHCNTIQSIINKWAPASDGNNPTNYAASIARTTGYSLTTTINANDRDKLCHIAYAMAIVENGSAPILSDVYTAWNLI